MSLKRKKAGLVISWQKSFSILAPWRKGKGNRDTVLDRGVVLTKMKLFRNLNERLLMADDSVSTISTGSVSDQDILDLTKASVVNSHLQDKSTQPQKECGSDYLSSIFSHSQLPKLYKFESEDSGVEMPSGANSPSTPTGSEHSFVVHSRESSCDSCNLNSDPNRLPNRLGLNSPSSKIKKAKDSVDDSLNTTVDTQDNVFIHKEEFSSSATTVELNKGKVMDQSEVSEGFPEEDGEKLGQSEETISLTERSCSENMRSTQQSSTETCDVTIGKDVEPLRQSATRGSLEEYMDQCCRLSEAQQQSSSPLGSGLGYLKHICQLIEKIGQLQETNLRLQRQICSLQKDDRMTKTNEDFFQQHCSCGAAMLAFQEIKKRLSKNEFLSPSGTLSDLSTIPEVTRHPLISNRRGTRREGLTPIPQWKRSLNRRSYAEEETHFLGDMEGLFIPQCRRSENNTWGRMKDLVRKTTLRNHDRLGLTSTSLKMSCPQLYRPDLEPVEHFGRNRNSMIALGQQSKLDISWLL
ncbi:uncharacterized protein PAE49_021556 [Odontesthes bonariensis]|uniref:uncharacterized protein LOC142397977 n=1 Tax=Odontesthes bonariensis TaxID=219752 RepID=UPI003F59017D